MVLASTSELGDYGLLGSANSILLWLIMLLIGVFALYFSANWIVKEKSMLIAIIVVVVAYIISYALSLVPTVGWVLTVLFIIAYIAVIKLVYCKGPRYGWTEAVLIWIITVVLSFVLALVFTGILIVILGTLDRASDVNPILTYITLAVVMVVALYILYWAITRIVTKPRSSRYDYD
jgi:hypothetical protein